MALQRYMPYINVNLETSPYALYRSGYFMYDLLTANWQNSNIGLLTDKNLYPNGGVQRYTVNLESIPQAYVVGMKPLFHGQNQEGIWTYEGGGTLTIDDPDAGSFSDSSEAFTKVYRKFDYKVNDSDKPNDLFMPFNVAYKNGWQGVMLKSTYSTLQNQNFLITLYMYKPPEKYLFGGVETDVDFNGPPRMSIIFGGMWMVAIFPLTGEAKLYKWKESYVFTGYATDEYGNLVPQFGWVGEWSEVSSSPIKFEYNVQYDLLFQFVDKHIFISNGAINAGSGAVWQYTDKNLDRFATSQDMIDLGAMPETYILTKEAPVYLWSDGIPLQFGLHRIYYKGGAYIQSPVMIHQYNNGSDDPQHWIPNASDPTQPGIIEPKMHWVCPEQGAISTPPHTYGVTGDTNWYYYVYMGEVDESNQFDWETNYIYTPYIYSVDATIDPTFVAADYTGSRTWTVPEGRVLGGTVTATTRDYKGSITLDNYDGLYSGLSGFVRCYIDAGWYMIDTDTGIISLPGYSRIFTGYAYDPVYTKDTAGHSTVVLQLMDPGVILRELYAVMLPVYDGACMYFALHDMIRRAGFQEDPLNNPYGWHHVFAAQDTTLPDIYTTLQEALGITDWAKCQFGLCDHIILPMDDPAQPKFKFSDGTPLENCIQDINNVKRNWIYFNNWGNLIIHDPMLGFMPDPSTADFFFTEIINEVQLSSLTPTQINGLNVKFPVSQISNSVRAIGGSVLNLSYNITSREKDLRIGSAPNYRPWYKITLYKSAQFASSQVALIADTTFKKATRPKVVASFDSNGNPYVKPYMVVAIEEWTGDGYSSPVLIGHDQGVDVPLERWRVTSVTHTFTNVSKFEYTCSYETEWITPEDIYLYDPCL